jgi:hypothetical protein
MHALSSLALKECVAELRAACRRPIDDAALQALVTLLRPSFEHILDDDDGATRWIDHGAQMRDHGRHLGALADFFGYAANVRIVGANELQRAFTMIQTACRVGAEHKLA